MSEFSFGGEVVWRPSDEIVAQSRLKQFMDRHGIGSCRAHIVLAAMDGDTLVSQSSGFA